MYVCMCSATTTTTSFQCKGVWPTRQKNPLSPRSLLQVWQEQPPRAVSRAAKESQPSLLCVKHMTKKGLDMVDSDETWVISTGRIPGPDMAGDSDLTPEHLTAKVDQYFVGCTQKAT